MSEWSQKIPGAFLEIGNSSFHSFISKLNSDGPALPHNDASSGSELQVPHGTTIVAVTYAEGVIIAGDRRATAGNLIARRDMTKVFPTDRHSAIGIAGVAGLAISMAKAFRLELEHYEKIEGVSLSLPGKANHLSNIVRGNLPMAMEGLVVAPLFVGYDVNESDPCKAGKIFDFDVTGNVATSTDYDSIGSGSLFAKAALKKRYQPESDENTAAELCIQALYDAAEDDSATGGIDTIRGIYPSVTVVNAQGVRELSEDDIRVIAERVIFSRQQNPNG